MPAKTPFENTDAVKSMLGLFGLYNAPEVVARHPPPFGLFYGFPLNQICTWLASAELCAGSIMIGRFLVVENHISLSYKFPIRCMRTVKQGFPGSCKYPKLFFQILLPVRNKAVPARGL